MCRPAMSPVYDIQQSESSKCNVNFGFESVTTGNPSDKMPMLVVGTEKPFVVLEVNDKFVSKFGYDKNVICGRSISFLQGPKTDSMQLLQALGTESKDSEEPEMKKQHTGSSLATAKSLILYSNSGMESSLSVSSTPIKTVDGVSKRLVSFSESQAIPLDVARKESDDAKVIIEISPRQAVLFANSRFLDVYGLVDRQVSD